jgi:osmotically inducible lipoprotein OsmB
MAAARPGDQDGGIARPMNPSPHRKQTMNHIQLARTLGLATLALALGACGNMSTRDKNTATGAVIGGAAGAILTGGSTAGTVGGAAVGGVIGNQVDPKKR